MVCLLVFVYRLYIHHHGWKMNVEFLKLAQNSLILNVIRSSYIFMVVLNVKLCTVYI